MRCRQVIATGSLCWAVVGWSIALGSLPTVNDDAIVLVAASIGFPLCALCARWALHPNRGRLAGSLLVASAATPTYFAYALNLPALIVGLTLLVAPNAALGERRRVPTISSVEPGQCTSIRCSNNLDDAGAVASIGSVGDSFDNAMAESLIGLYKRECVRHDGPFRTVDELELATLDWVDWFNHDRLHSALGHVPPIEFETEHYRQINDQQQPLLGEPSLH